ncbi:heat shock 70 kDa protein 12B-like isoform X2 [Ostrea edulis]|uniref:heat shock 70 kDa protein 12B-like isoform X2 n=1 Tax=Ostrea edulis TaxID=37623 RepID=UPI0024AF5E32|nr:heat shock 70 kDa protein 12B-like isoform X2 [Ostrea edulis]
MTSSEKDSYLFVAAIGFGTSYSECSFSSKDDFVRNPTNAYSKEWLNHSSGKMSKRTPTCILFTKEKEFRHFGFEAEVKYAELMNTNEHKEWFLFKRFKTSFYALTSSDADVVMEDENGKPMTVLTVFSESIRYLKDSLLEECRAQNTDVKLNDVKWVITVPVISSDPEKSFMRLAATEAGINPEMLTLALKPKEALFVAAIDFGTTYSGYAFSSRDDFKRDPTKAYLKRWIDPSSTMMYNKTSTCVLFTKEGKFSHFGFDAECKYSDLMENNDHKEWYFFRRFKMCLYALKSCNENINIKDETGKPMRSLTVFAESIRYMKDSFLEQCRWQNTDLQLDDIKWVITVPAIWSDPAKSFMRLAAIEAGIDSEMLAIVLEPEAAAIYVKHILVERKDDEQLRTFAPGSKRNNRHNCT